MYRQRKRKGLNLEIIIRRIVVAIFAILCVSIMVFILLSISNHGIPHAATGAL